MTECPICSYRFHVDLHNPPTHCPECGGRLRVDRSSDWAPVARLSNLADCGYFSDLLEQHKIEVQVKEIDEFSALLGLWEPVFVLQVRHDDSQRAAELMAEQASHDDGLRREAADETALLDTNASPASRSSEHELWPPKSDGFNWPSDGATTGSAPFWKSMAVVLVASGLAYSVGLVTGRRDADAIPAGDRDQLWQVLSQPGESFVSEGPPGARRYRLRFDAQTNRIEMDEDIDGDGQFDRHRLFERGQLVPK